MRRPPRVAPRRPPTHPAGYVVLYKVFCASRASRPITRFLAVSFLLSETGYLRSDLSDALLPGHCRSASAPAAVPKASIRCCLNARHNLPRRVWCRAGAFHSLPLQCALHREEPQRSRAAALCQGAKSWHVANEAAPSCEAPASVVAPARHLNPSPSQTWSR
jgi:hypothetical protein